ncbi:IS200/IS605 family accessory protein TnpB-related protein [Anaerobacillus sp. MEB173]|uniref:IS200/IS605 family accessory protein TnpB-related protein n=1 Tax=Anaerobacillus sp. MEB173 TaxID=3383345 RepID=UPI003F920581
MKVTRTLKMIEKDETKLHELNELMRVFCSAVRYSFNRLQEGLADKALIKEVNRKYGINKRYAEDAVLFAQSTLKSQKELLPQRIEAVQAKKKKTEQKLQEYKDGRKKPKKVDLLVCIEGLTKRIAKLTEKEKMLIKHQEENTVPKVIFGGRKNFYARMKGKLSREEWKMVRSNTLYSRGDRSKKGNLNTRVVYDEGKQSFFLEVANPLLLQTGKRNAPRIRLALQIPDKFFEEIIAVIFPNEVGTKPNGKAVESYIPYTIEIKRMNESYFVHLTYDYETHGKEVGVYQKLSADRVAGIDVNVDRIAVSILNQQGNLLKVKTFYCHELEYVLSNKRENICGETAKDIVEWLLTEHVGAIILEDIHIKQDHDTNRKLNRLTHQFTKTKVQRAVTSRAVKNGIDVKKVHPAYTSVIGRFKYSKPYSLSVHEAAAFVIGRRGLGFDEKLPKALLKQVQQSVKPHLISLLGSMEETEKKSTTGKAKRRYLGMLLKNIETFKEQHVWKLWNVFIKHYK